MPVYKVSIWSSLFIDAESIEEAEDVAHDHVIGCLIKPREFEFDTELWEDDYDVEIIDYKTYTEKEQNNGQ